MEVAISQRHERGPLGTVVRAVRPPTDAADAALQERPGDVGTVPEKRRQEHSEEDVLRGLLAAEQPILDELNRAKAQLAAKVLEMLNDPHRALLITKVLREVVATSNAINKRQQNVATALAALRAQRHLLALHQGGRDGV